MSYEQMSGPELVAEYNTMAAAMGRTPVKRFANLDAARRRTAALAVEFSAQSQPVNKARAETVEASTYATPVKAAVPTTGLESLSLRQLTEQFNELVADAARRGVETKAKHHKSLFENKALGVRQLRKLMEEVGQ